MARSTNPSSMVSIVYQFIFSKDANIWSNITEFEQDISDFFKNNGLECDIVTTVSGSGGGRIILIKKIDDIRTLKNLKGVDLRNKPGKPSATMAKGFTNQLSRSFNKQFPGKSGNNKLLK